ncbi:hypothetical protein E8E12_006846 [Didymella heteroderae]|uniref:Uncharacterized protein n=1 Tax=Didymella heteroderae TaxID=1769908 RepID=A0A9P5C012_9PLEO|nr:hypothetical protein E8E12_006846 [Didymella heteroderae]
MRRSARIEQRSSRDAQEDINRTNQQDRHQGASADPQDLKFRKNKLKFSSNSFEKFFRPTVSQFLEKVRAFATRARQNEGYDVDRIVVTGGFADSPDVKAEFTKLCKDLNDKWVTGIQPAFSLPNSSAMGVAVGGIYRSIDKANGPLRLPCQSIGMLRYIPCDTVDFSKLPPDVQSQDGSRNPDTNIEYIHDVIEWPIKKGQGVLRAEHAFQRLSEFVFGLDEVWIRGEQFW